MTAPEPPIGALFAPVLVCAPMDGLLSRFVSSTVPHEAPKHTAADAVGRCSVCDTSVWVGPRQQEVLRRSGCADICCYECLKEADAT